MNKTIVIDNNGSIVETIGKKHFAIAMYNVDATDGRKYTRGEIELWNLQIGSGTDCFTRTQGFPQKVFDELEQIGSSRHTVDDIETIVLLLKESTVVEDELGRPVLAGGKEWTDTVQ